MKGCIFVLVAIFSLVILGIATIVVLGIWDNYKYVKECPSYNVHYTEWFPYSKGDQLHFSSGELNRTMIVSHYSMNHRNTYHSNKKCGCCEEGVSLVLNDEKHHLEINFQNYLNEASCFRFSYELNRSTSQNDSIFRDSLMNGRVERIVFWNNVLAVKNIGVKSFKDEEGKVWVLDQTNHKGHKEEIQIENCY